MREILCTVFWGKKTTRQATVSVADSCRFLNRQKAAQKPPGVRKIAERRRSSWRRATARVCKQTVPGARIQVRALSRSRFSQSRNSFYYTFTPLYFYLLCFLLLRVKIPSAFSRCAEIDLSGLRALGTGGRKGLIFLYLFSSGPRRIPRKATCGWFWWHLLPPKGAGPA